MLTPSSHASVATFLMDFGEKLRHEPPLRRLVNNSLQEGFSRFKEKVGFVVQAREGLCQNKRMTLEEVGNLMCLSRERVRQIEKRFWDRLLGRNKELRRPFLIALLCDFMDVAGSLVVRHGSPMSLLRMFLAKCAGIPQRKIPQLGISVFAPIPMKLISPKSHRDAGDLIDVGAVAVRLDSQNGVVLMDRDIRVLAENLVESYRRRSRPAERIYLALRTIGKPAHYSTITEVHNLLFPEHEAKEINVHAYLWREEGGVVWVGMKGTYALKEWGYRRPSKGLFERVALIVEEVHKRTGKPVPLTVIIAEIGRYRRVMKPSSVVMAAHLNPRLQCVHKSSFIPTRSSATGGNVDADRLDKILEKFRAKI